MTVAIVVGGAVGVHEEVAAARSLCLAAEVSPTFFVANDMIAEFDGEFVAVTLHPDKVRGWWAKRREAGLPPPTTTYCLLPGPLSTARGKSGRIALPEITNVMEDWGGSVGLYGVKVAMERGHAKIILAGVPMDADREHFLRGRKWPVCSVFWSAWEFRHHQIAPFVRSMSGRTQRVLGAPTQEWLREEHA